MTNIEKDAQSATRKSGLRRVAALLTMLAIGSVMLSACVVYPDGPYRHGDYYGDDHDDGWHHHHHDWDR